MFAILISEWADFLSEWPVFLIERPFLVYRTLTMSGGGVEKDGWPDESRAGGKRHAVGIRDL